jgi:hypothetical protein
MNPKERNELIDTLLEGDISEADLLRVEAELSINPAARKAYFDRVALSQALTEEAKSLQTKQASTVTKHRTIWLQWRPLTAAAAGLVFGMFCTSVVFGFVAQRAAVNRTPLPVFDPSFEGMKPLDKGLPHNAEQWGVRSARIVSVENGVSPLQGQHMLRMEPILLNEQDANRYSHAYQVLDLRSQHLEAASGTMEVQVAASFCALPSEVKARYVIRVVALNEPPETATENFWSKTEDAGVVSLTQRFATMAGDGGWHLFSVKMPLPQGVQSLIIVLTATSPKGEAIPAPVSYLDDLRVDLLTSEAMLP